MRDERLEKKWELGVGEFLPLGPGNAGRPPSGKGHQGWLADRKHLDSTPQR